MRPVNLSIRMVAVRRGRRAGRGGGRGAVQGLLLDWRKHFLLPTIFLGTAEKTTTSTKLHHCGQLDVTVTASIDRHVCYGSGPTATVLVYHRYLRSRKGVRKGRTPTGQATICHSLTRWSATFDTVFRRPGTGKVPDQCSNHRSPRRSPRSKNGSRFSRPEGPGHSNCKELLQPVGPLLPPSQTLEYIGSLLRFVLHPQLFSNSHRPRQSSGSARHTGSRWCHMAPQSFLPQFFIALKVWYRRGS
jgi:hypothetical protein